ncbi:MAG: 5-formyltetrahydrofolate cyclo-ligase [Candidatus Cloacimonetes bacterium]|nr:5-formyltetrahydrofolate cyclo-ligase [Candidatus Cloacimonadota bacterium]
MKNYLRKRFKKLRAKGSKRSHKKRSKQICLKLASYIKASYPSNSNILLFDPLLGEVNVLFLLDLLPEMNFFLPRVLSKTKMEAVPFSSIQELIPHKFGTRSLPNHVKAVSANSIHVVIIPGLVFSEIGERLGFGGGYYDRFLQQGFFKKIGVCFKSQMVNPDLIPMNEYDIFMDLVING